MVEQGALTATLAQHPAPDRDYQAGLLGERDEVVRSDAAALGMAPPHQRLHAADRAVAQPHHRLVIKLELVVDERPLQVGA